VGAVLPSVDQAAPQREQRRPAKVLDEALLQDSDVELRQLLNKRLEEENTTLKENRAMRDRLIKRLTVLSVIWLAFTGIVVLCLTFGVGRLSDVVATAFITTSLATVLGLWVIGLRYFFSQDILSK